MVKAVVSELPAAAPKKTGKRGPRPAPLDPVEDFETPVRAAAREAIGILEVEAVEEEEIAGAEDPQGQLLEIPESEMPAPVMGERMLVHYIRPTFKKTKKGERTISLEFSLPLTDEHEELIPGAIKAGWKFLAKKGNKRLDITDVPAHIVKLWLAHDSEKEALVLPVAEITNVSLATIQAKGSGKTQKVIRLSFRAMVKMSAAVGKFAEFHFEENLWLEWNETQEQLFEEDEEE